MTDGPALVVPGHRERTPRRVHLHIGTMKSGTSYLQNVLGHQSELLAAAGFLYPGNTGRAVHDVLGRPGPRSLGDTDGAWSELVATIRAWPGHSVVVSMEFLGLATPEQVRRIVASLRPSDVFVVLTARDLVRTLPSAWQQLAKNRQHTTWNEFLRAVMAGSHSPVADQFWLHHDLCRIAATWSSVLGADRVTVLTVPGSDCAPATLWNRFAAAVDIDPAQIPADGGGRGNPSLGHAEAELLRRLNAGIGADIDQPAYRRLVIGLLAHQLLRSPPHTPSRPPPMPREVLDWARQRSERTIRTLVALGTKVAGDLAELDPLPGRSDQEVRMTGARMTGARMTGAWTTEVAPAELARLTVRAAAGLVTELARSQASMPDGDRPGQRATGGRLTPAERALRRRARHAAAKAQSDT